MPETEVRPMREDDLDAVLMIERLCFSVPWSRDSFRMEINENRCARYIVLTEDGTPVAYAGAWLIIDEGHITNIAVHPDYRGNGYGERVTRALMETCREIGISWMTLEVRRSNAVAQNLYRKLGFTDVGYRKRYYEDNKEDALIMVNENIGETLAEAGND